MRVESKKNQFLSNYIMEQPSHTQAFKLKQYKNKTLSHINCLLYTKSMSIEIGGIQSDFQ